ncbi:acyltransferase [Listeria sp. SHR_NRA_18]|nr:acyltransferase [Listeria sp. SHR_NRA_18]
MRTRHDKLEGAIRLSNRLFFLDALRGIAALTVIITHFAETYAGESLIKGIFQPFGRSAVILFFLISGISLSMSFQKKISFSWQEYMSYSVRRIFRIYIPFIVAILIGEGIYLILQPQGIAELSKWFNLTGTDTSNFSILIENIFMTGNYVNRINPVIWSLIIELRISAIFPLLYLIAKKYGAHGACLLMFGSLVTGVAILYSLTPKFLLGQTVFYIAFFVLGIVISMYWSNSKDMSKRVYYLIGIPSLLLYFHVVIFNLLGIPTFKIISDVVIGLGSAGILLFFYESKMAQKHLTNRMYQVIGKISFSIYLVHCIVFIPMVYMMQQMKREVWIIQGISIPIIFICAYIFYGIVEYPSKILGQSLSRKIESRKRTGVRLY